MTPGDGFTRAEREAMRQRAAELREQKASGRGGAKRERDAQACDDVIASLTGTDRAVSEAVHAIVLDEAPHLDPKTWYGFPAYATDGDVVVFVQPAAKFDTRYATVGFNDCAHLDDGACWPTSFAVVDVTPDVVAQLRALIRRAAPAATAE